MFSLSAQRDLRQNGKVCRNKDRTAAATDISREREPGGDGQRQGWADQTGRCFSALHQHFFGYAYLVMMKWKCCRAAWIDRFRVQCMRARVAWSADGLWEPGGYQRVYSALRSVRRKALVGSQRGLMRSTCDNPEDCACLAPILCDRRGANFASRAAEVNVLDLTLGLKVVECGLLERHPWSRSQCRM